MQMHTSKRMRCSAPRIFITRPARHRSPSRIFNRQFSSNSTMLRRAVCAEQRATYISDSVQCVVEQERWPGSPAVSDTARARARERDSSAARTNWGLSRHSTPKMPQHQSDTARPGTHGGLSRAWCQPAKTSTSRARAGVLGKVPSPLGPSKLLC